VVPGRLRGLSGGNLYDATAIDALRERGWAVEAVEPGDPLQPADVVVLDSLAFRHGPPATRAPLVAVAHQLPSDAAGRPNRLAAERAVLEAASLVVTVARWLEDRLRRLTDTPVAVVTPGRDRAWAPDGPANDADTVLCVGNPLPGKGLPEGVEVFLAAGAAGATLVVAGDPGWDPVEARRLGRVAGRAGERVSFVGPLPPEELSDRYRRARLLLTASAYEGWPIAVAEAMASGLPVAGYDVAGLRELVRPDRDGLLVPRGEPAALGAAARTLWEDRDLARRLGDSARRRALVWPTWRETGQRFADLVEGLVRPTA
jgi:glycosyltransferase involved in cell wall biosynthesis